MHQQPMCIFRRAAGSSTWSRASRAGALVAGMGPRAASAGGFTDWLRRLAEGDGFEELEAPLRGPWAELLARSETARAIADAVGSGQGALAFIGLLAIVLGVVAVLRARRGQGATGSGQRIVGGCECPGIVMHVIAATAEKPQPGLGTLSRQVYPSLEAGEDILVPVLDYLLPRPRGGIEGGIGVAEQDRAVPGTTQFQGEVGVPVLQRGAVAHRAMVVQVHAR